MYLLTCSLMTKSHKLIPESGSSTENAKKLNKVINIFSKDNGNGYGYGYGYGLKYRKRYMNLFITKQKSLMHLYNGNGGNSLKTEFSECSDNEKILGVFPSFIIPSN